MHTFPVEGSIGAREGRDSSLGGLRMERRRKGPLEGDVIGLRKGEESRPASVGKVRNRLK
jgi:hypothetical protein